MFDPTNGIAWRWTNAQLVSIAVTRTPSVPIPKDPIIVHVNRGMLQMGADVCLFVTRIVSTAGCVLRQISVNVEVGKSYRRRAATQECLQNV